MKYDIFSYFCPDWVPLASVKYYYWLVNGRINFSKNCVKDGALGIERDLMAIFRAGIERVDSYQMLIEHVQKLDQNLEIQFEGQNLKLDLRNY